MKGKGDVWPLNKVVNPASVETGGTTDYPMDFVPLAKKQLGKVRSVLASNAKDQCSLSHAGEYTQQPTGQHKSKAG
jgi:hypothetical protein